MTADLIVRDATWLDVAAGTYREGDLTIRDGRFVDLDERPARGDVREVDAGGRFVLPGLIDCHVHVTAHTAALGSLGAESPNYVAMQASRLMGDMLDRGFTTVRDVAGADFGLHDAQREGLLRGPRLFFGGKALSQTGGHADPRERGESHVQGDYTCSHIGRIADGVDAVRHAARDELRKGAHHVKIMAGGGVASPTDRIDSTQYSLEEIAAVVHREEAGEHDPEAEEKKPGEEPKKLGVEAVLKDATLHRAHEDAEVVAEALLQGLHKRTRAPRRGVFQAPFGVLKEAAMPAVVVEVGFLSHAEEGKKLLDKKYQRKIARGIADAIIALDRKLGLR